MDTSLLFSPLEIRGKRLRNRIVMPPMVTLRGLTTPDGVEWYARHARGGVGLVIVEATGVNRFGRELTGRNLKPLVDGIHLGGALAAIQLFPVTFGRAASPGELSTDEIEEILSHYRIAAGVCVEAGFDGLEPHGAHGFLLNQFFSPLQNARKDEYGVSIENRMRMGLRIVETVRPVCGEKMLVLYRHTPVGEGYGVDDSLVFARRLLDAGVDVLDISPASDQKPADRAAPFMKLGAPVIAVNDMDDVSRAIEALANRRADLIAVGRGLIADP